jgi:hypothetical protein
MLLSLNYSSIFTFDPKGVRDRLMARQSRKKEKK